MKRKSLILTILFMLSLIFGCGKVTQAKEPQPDYLMQLVKYCDKRGNIEEWKDNETGVHYFICDEHAGYGGLGGICPRYNADGSLYVD